MRGTILILAVLWTQASAQQDSLFFPRMIVHDTTVYEPSPWVPSAYFLTVFPFFENYSVAYIRAMPPVGLGLAIAYHSLSLTLEIAGRETDVRHEFTFNGLWEDRLPLDASYHAIGLGNEFRVWDSFVLRPSAQLWRMKIETDDRLATFTGIRRSMTITCASIGIDASYFFRQSRQETMSIDFGVTAGKPIGTLPSFYRRTLLSGSMKLRIYLMLERAAT